MTTQHQAPEVTRPIIGIENRTAQEVFDIMCDRFTRATQPLSLTVDEGLASSVRSLHVLTTDDVARNGPMSSTMVRAGLLLDILDRLQSLSLPAAGEQIAENANCSGDIDRSGLAQEVE